MVERGDLAEERIREIGPVLGRLLSVRWGDEWDKRLEEESPEQVRHRTFLALYDFFVALAVPRPVALVFEDLHWADTLSLDLISLLMEALPGRRLLLMCVYRPERERRCQRLAMVAARRCGDRYTELHLRELTGDQSWQMVGSLLATEALPSKARELILAQSQGNPFFIEEVVRSLIDAGIVYPEGDAWRARDEIETLPVPASVQSVISSRIDRLENEMKRVLQVASVIGRVFRRRVLAQTLHREEELESILWELEERALVYRERAIPAVEYSFKHVLMREIIYRSMPHDHRAAIHRQVAEAICASYSDSLEEHCEQLAHHYDAAGDAEKAVGYLLQVGERAQRSYANEEAIAHLDRGLELLRSLPATPEHARMELDLLVALGVPLVLTRGHPAVEVRCAYARAQELSERVGDARQRFHVLMGLRRYYLHGDEVGRALDVGEQLLALAESLKDADYLSRAHMMHGETLYWLGEFLRARRHCEAGLAFCDPRRAQSHALLYGNDSGVGCRISLALSLWHLGYPDQAAQTARELLALAEEIAHPFTLVYALYFTAILHQMRREVGIVQKQAEEAVHISNEQGFSLYLAWATALQGWALAALGRYAEGIENMKAGITALRATGGTTLLPYLLASQAEACGNAGEPDKALRLVGEGMALAEARGERFWEAELHRLKGELTLVKAKAEVEAEDKVEAETWFQRAIEVARRQGARSWELRAATSLARLWQAQGRRQEARALLGDIYGWFTEGFDTADLMEARALLDSLL
jgi:predicted ATPase